MRSDLRERFEKVKKSFDAQKPSSDQAALETELNCFIEAQCFAADRLRKLAFSLEEEAKEYVLLRDLVREMK